MATPSDQRYDVYLSGECREGFTVQAVRAALGKLFSADSATLDRLLSGQRQRIKRNCDKNTAQRYLDALHTAGAVATFEPINTATDSAAAPAAEGLARGKQAQPLSVAPPGSDVLTAHERAAPVTASIATEQFSLAPEGPIPARVVPTPPAPDTSALTLSEGQLDLSDCAQEPPAQPALDLDDLSLADAGSDLGQLSDKKVLEVEVPDFSLAPKEDPQKNE